ncbi:MAG: ATP-binding protein [Chloroflexota bacterium]|nr:ATP-binding protein [Chloroflexota bacterium]
MNRLWVRITIVIAGIVLFVALMPVATRLTTRSRDYTAAVATVDENTERCAKEQRLAEDRIWKWVSRDLLFGGGIGLMASVLLSQWLVAPFRQIEKGTRAVAERRLDYRVPEVGSQEMRSVAHSFNRMAMELERQEMLRRNLLADVTHELRHPVHVLQGSLQAILDGVYPLNMEEVALMLEQTQHLTTLVDDLHALALAEAHELPLHRQLTDIGELVQETTEAVAPFANEKGITLTVARPSDPIHLSVDPQRLRQAVHNLLSNALRYTPELGQIAVEVVRRGEHVALAVRDSGIGIPASDLPYLFDRFYRGDASRNRGAGGAGLGLAIVKAVAEAHGGHVTVHSPGHDQGSTFTLYLPIDDATSDAGGG